MTATRRPTATSTPTDDPTATLTSSPTPTSTATATLEPSATNTSVPTATDEPTLTATPEVTDVALAAVATDEPTAEPTDAATPEATEPASAAPAATTVASVPTGVPVPGIQPRNTSPDALPLEALVGGLGLLAVLGYASLYWRGAAAAERYPTGFVISRCPICRQGRLTMDKHTVRTLGIPRVRRTVRCDNCRSTLREVGPRKWRYTIDPNVNQNMYHRYNGRVLDEDFLRALPNQPHIRPTEPRPPSEPPTFVDDEQP